MSDSTQTIVLITGVARGLGKALLEAYLSRPNHTVIGTIRSGDPSTSPLLSLPTGPGSRVLLFTLESSNPSDYPALVTQIESAGITHLDVVIPNSGISPPPAPLATVRIESITSAFDVNALGTLRLFQGVRHLLEKAPRDTTKGSPKWVSMSSGAGSVASIEMFGIDRFAGYAISKIAVNWVTVAIHTSEKWLTAFAIHPGLVQTDMGNTGARTLGLEEAPTTIDEAVSKALATIDGATRETTSGKFLSTMDGTEVPW
ncbi:hypothetical protein BJX99DRAFT_267448 [Aspergillus californicus]